MKKKTGEHIIELSLPDIEQGTNGAPIQMDTKQRNRANRFIRDMCANYDNGYCLPLDCKCPQCNSFTVLCKYFRHVILKANYIPGARALESELFGTKPVKVCKECGRPFIPGSNRAKYCHDCTERVHRRNAASSVRKKRAKC